jgi:3'-5' exoribonuclease
MFEQTEVGRLLGHVVLGALMIDRRLDEEEQPVCTPPEQNLLLHMVLSHHGRLEWGAPVTPMILEAEVVHWADNASAKTAGIADAIREDNNFPDGLVSIPQRMLEYRRVFRGRSDWGLGENVSA